MWRPRYKSRYSQVRRTQIITDIFNAFDINLSESGYDSKMNIEFVILKFRRNIIHGENDSPNFIKWFSIYG